MAKSVVEVDPWICGFPARISASSEDCMACSLVIESGCEAITALAAELTQVDAYEVAFTNFAENPLYLTATRHYMHAADVLSFRFGQSDSLKSARGERSVPGAPQGFLILARKLR
ncbi:MAG: hypothetical protein WCQ50_09485 [Spirochaetota bacterium]